MIAKTLETSSIENDLIFDGLKINQRTDGRGLEDYRQVDIWFY